MPCKLFLSSTYTYLADERAAAERVILAMGQQFVGMEYFFAREETLLDALFFPSYTSPQIESGEKKCKSQPSATAH